MSVTFPKASPLVSDSLHEAVRLASQKLLSCQSDDGYWWFTLEANESINAEFILLLHYLGCLDLDIQQGIVHRILQTQNQDGSWSLYYGGPGDLSTTIECYFALKLSNLDINSECLTRAVKFIVNHGGIPKARVFTKIHLALFGLVPWKACPAMPVSFIHMPNWLPVNIYEFSSWARATIVPLLVMMDQKNVFHKINHHFLDELYLEQNPKERNWSTKTNKGFFSPQYFFIQLNRLLKKFDAWSLKPFRKSALKKCEAWIRGHIARTEDIYPALAYSAMALHSLGFDPKKDPTIQKCLTALKNFQMPSSQTKDLAPLPLHSRSLPAGRRGAIDDSQFTIYQQCCISPVWDTPWACMALLESGIHSDFEELQKAADWLVSKQITNFYGDWAVKNKDGKPGGWSFEFENDYFPDIDDTIEVLLFLKKIKSPSIAIRQAIKQGIEWILSMQSAIGGWGAFDRNNHRSWVNKIPFSDHGACLDPPTPDVTGRCLEILAEIGFKMDHPVTRRAIQFIEKNQELNGSFEGRWGVNYIYGTWCVLQGLEAIDYNMKSEKIKRSIEWLKSIQRSNGGYGESCHSYIEKKYIPLDSSVPSQTAWALMGLIAGGEAQSSEAGRAAEFLIESQESNGEWKEPFHTGTGFPGHFYIRYHGYRYYFPLLALAKYRTAIKL